MYRNHLIFLQTCRNLYSVFRSVYKVNLSKKFSLKKWSLDQKKFVFNVENTVIVMFSLIIAFLQNNEF